MRKVKKGLIRPHRLLNRACIADACHRKGGEEVGGGRRRMDGVVGGSADN